MSCKTNREEENIILSKDQGGIQVIPHRESKHHSASAFIYFSCIESGKKQKQIHPLIRKSYDITKG